MLRASAKREGNTIDITAVRDPFVDAGIDHASAILPFVDAIVLRDDEELLVARQRLGEQAGVATVEAVAAVTANFEMMNRILDATGVPVSARNHAIGEALGLTVPDHLLG